MIPKEPMKLTHFEDGSFLDRKRSPFSVLSSDFFLSIYVGCITFFSAAAARNLPHGRIPFYRIRREVLIELFGQVEAAAREKD